ncbi:MAG: hypothetical protein ACRERD_35195 [Candidatus Binatia bacterium]
MKSFQRPALPVMLYDLGAASQILPPASVLPEQFYSPATGTATAHGEIALMRAVLEDAVNCFQKESVKSGRRAQRLAREAEEWLFRDDYHWPFSFVNICGVLGLNPEYVRLGLKRWRQHRPAELQKRKRRTAPTRQTLQIAA